MDLGRSSREASKEGDGIANVEAADSVGVDEFTEETTVAKTVLALKGSMVGSILRGIYGVGSREHPGRHNISVSSPMSHRRNDQKVTPAQNQDPTPTS